MGSKKEPSKNNRALTALQLVSVIILIGSFGKVIFGNHEYIQAETLGESDLKVIDAKNVPDIEVKDSISSPEPLDYNIQGSVPGQQQAEGGLQKQQNVNNLQPNAKTDQTPGPINQ